MPALVIGLDPHKASNTIAVLDAEETLVARRRFENTADGLVAMSDPASLMRVELAFDHIEDMKRFDRRIDDVTLKIHAAVKASGTTVTRIYGVGAVSAGLILGEVGDISRFPTRNHFASYTGTAPVAVSSGDRNRHRLNRAGNRRLNHAIHIAAIAQIRYDTPGRAYFRRKLGEGKSRREALRCLKRRISDAVWRQLQLDRETDQHQDHSWPRWPSARGDFPSYRSPDTPRQTASPRRSRRCRRNLVNGLGCGPPKRQHPRRKLTTRTAQRPTDVLICPPQTPRG